MIPLLASERGATAAPSSGRTGVERPGGGRVLGEADPQLHREELEGSRRTDGACVIGREVDVHRLRRRVEGQRRRRDPADEAGRITDHELCLDTGPAGGDDAPRRVGLDGHADVGHIGHSTGQILDGVVSHGLAGNFMWANDYPHHEGTWPHSAQAIERTMGQLTDEARAKVLGLNAARFLGVEVPARYRTH